MARLSRQKGNSYRHVLPTVTDTSFQSQKSGGPISTCLGLLPSTLVLANSEEDLLLWDSGYARSLQHGDLCLIGTRHNMNALQDAEYLIFDRTFNPQTTALRTNGQDTWLV